MEKKYNRLKPASPAQRWSRKRAEVLFWCLMPAASMLQRASMAFILSAESCNKLYKAATLMQEVFTYEKSEKGTCSSKKRWIENNL